jgi:hypothetical protein
VLRERRKLHKVGNKLRSFDLAAEAVTLAAADLLVAQVVTHEIPS